MRAALLVLATSIGLLSPVVAAPALAAAKPVITRLGIATGPLEPTDVVIRGRNLRGVTAVRFGSRSGVVVRRTSSTSVTVRTPSGMKAGTVSVRVKTSSGWSAVSKKARYTFVAAPALSKVSPASGYFSGGTRVTLTGKNFETATRVLFGTSAATILIRKTGSLVVRTPIGTLGANRVTITTRGGTALGTYTYTKPATHSSLALTAAPPTFVAADVAWVTGGLDTSTGKTNPWLVGLPKGAALPAVGQQFLVRPGNPAFASGLAGTVTEVAEQLDETVRVKVSPTDLEKAVSSLSLDYSGSVVDPNAGYGAQAVEVGKAFQVAIKGPTPLSCQDKDAKPVSFGVDLTTTVTGVDADVDADFGSLFRKPSFDGSFTAELQTTGKITVAAAATCKIKPQWADAQRRVIPLGATGMTLSFGPAFEFKISGKGTWSIVDRTRSTFAVSATVGKRPTFSRTSRSVSSTQSGDLAFSVEVTGGVSMQLGLLDRAGLQGKVELGVSAELKASTEPNICVSGELYGKMAIGVFLDAVVARWERDAFTAKISLSVFNKCVRSENPVPSGEPEITSARMPDATIGNGYSATLATADGRPGGWSIVRDALPAGLTLDPDGSITGTPTGPVGDYPAIVAFTDASDRVATTTIRIMVQPGAALGGGDVQATLRWSGAADLDLHVFDPSGEEIYYLNPSSASGGRLDHDANADCNGPEDDDNPVENVYWPTGKAPRGSYTVVVRVYKTCDAPVDWHLSVRRNGALVVDQDGSGDSSAYTFTVGSAASAAAAVRVSPPATDTRGGGK